MNNRTAIAVIGMSARFPGAPTLESFWTKLDEGTDCITRLTCEELLASGVTLGEVTHPNYVPARGILQDAECFDAGFFGFTPREAELTDPQQRVLTECSWECLATVGYDPLCYEGTVGLYAGCSSSSYFLFNIYPIVNSLTAGERLQAIYGCEKDFLATRVAYKLNLRGPCMTLQTACSTSLVAVHAASQALILGECDMALAGGVSIVFPQQSGYLYQSGGISSPDGRCRAYDAEAQGAVTGAGVGVVLLKLLERAEADGDYVHAVIRGTAVNNDGAHKVSFTAPAMDAVIGVIRDALAVADVGPDTVDYIEGHGSGTPLGDAIELSALSEVFGTSAAGSCYVGSVKTNIGHLDAASGIAGLIKTVLALQKRRIPASLHFSRLNSHVQNFPSRLRIVQTSQVWKESSHPRRAGVTSLGIGGTNVHVMLEEARMHPSAPSIRSRHILPLSATTENSLGLVTAKMADHLASASVNIADVCYTSAAVRQHEWRRIAVCRSAEDAVDLLRSKNRQSITSGKKRLRNPTVSFLFPGFGEHYVNMARGIYEAELVFREHFDHCANIAEHYLTTDLRELVYSNDSSRTKPDPFAFAAVGDVGRNAGPLKSPLIGHTALFAVEFALAQVWMAWGIVPRVLAGYSLGELVAACLSGVFSVEDAILFVTRRAALIETLPPGSMLAVGIPSKELAPYLAGRVWLAATSGSSCVISGTPEAIAALRRDLLSSSIPCQPVSTSHALHCELMRPISDAVAEMLKAVKLKRPTIPCLSNTSGTWLKESEAVDPRYWADHLCKAVLFDEELKLLLRQREPVLIEVGPGNSLSSAALQYLKVDPSNRAAVISSLPSGYLNIEDEEHLLTSLGSLWVAGLHVDLAGVYRDEYRRRTPLPAYPFDKQRYWIQPVIAPAAAVSPDLRVDGTLYDVQRSASPSQATSSIDNYSESNPDQTDDSSSRIEEILLEMWRELLPAREIQISDNFFVLGGQSLLVIALLSRVRDTFDVKLPPRTVFEKPTIKQLAAEIEDLMLEALTDGAEEAFNE